MILSISVRVIKDTVLFFCIFSRQIRPVQPWINQFIMRPSTIHAKKWANRTYISTQKPTMRTVDFVEDDFSLKYTLNCFKGFWCSVQKTMRMWWLPDVGRTIYSNLYLDSMWKVYLETLARFFFFSIIPYYILHMLLLLSRFSRVRLCATP